MTEVVQSFGWQDTFALGQRLASKCEAGDLVLLNGDLGVGKTVFAQGFGKGLGISGPISSPTFTILKIYEEGRLPLYHFDVYRIASPEEMDEIGYEDYFFGRGVCLVEWAELIRECIPRDAIEIRIERELERGPDHRKITVKVPDAREVARRSG